MEYINTKQSHIGAIKITQIVGNKHRVGSDIFFYF